MAFTFTLATALAYKSRRTTASANAPKASNVYTTTDEDPQVARRLEGWTGAIGSKYPPGPNGLRYRCHHCGREVTSRGGATKHEKANGEPHLMLRVDWHDEGYSDYVMAQPGRNA